MTKTAAEFVAELKDNVDALYADQVDFDVFHARQQATWAAISDAGPAVDEEVLRMLREES